MAFYNMVNMQLMMFLLVGIGFLVRRKNIVGSTTRKELVDFCLYVTLPFNTFHSFQIEWEWTMLAKFAEVLLLSIGYNILSMAVSFFSYRKTRSDRQKPLRYGTIVSNGGFLGNPVVEGVYGMQGLFYASVFMLPMRIVMWSVGISCFLRDKIRLGDVLKKVLTHPCIVAIYLGLAVMVSGIDFPVFLDTTIEGISACNTPLSMMLVGMMLCEMKPEGIWDKTMLYYVSVRLIVIPAIVFAVTAWLPIPAILRGITVLISGMPAPVTTALLSSKYNGDETYATGMIFVTTVLSLFTLPVWSLLLG
ncbi:AEC family transporter [Faecalicatena acetigenes]|uniref:AEC family transporter n=1 Tax=Faecalicatena acetigenes TaxID=2981790 RepID=A0ABT2TBP2_9FIRM|nr:MULTISPECIES: AEC family transporter [Lachnospiraceae]MCU6747411.1 AEC family transporter [Faecalicatena acetigenes]SCH86232.1 auxin efflux carrier [uncultured Clostridium sp.]